MADITQIFYRIQEDTKDWLRRAEKAGMQIDEERRPAARLLDLRQAYPRVNKPALWRILEKYGMGERCLRALKDLHKTTVYKVKSREGCSNEWTILQYFPSSGDASCSQSQKEEGRRDGK